GGAAGRGGERATATLLVAWPVSTNHPGGWGKTPPPPLQLKTAKDGILPEEHCIRATTEFRRGSRTARIFPFRFGRQAIPVSFTREFEFFVIGFRRIIRFQFPPGAEITRGPVFPGAEPVAETGRIQPARELYRILRSEMRRVVIQLLHACPPVGRAFGRGPIVVIDEIEIIPGGHLPVAEIEGPGQRYGMAPRR